jgi:transitional endoplasmic reticulum ATPase
MGEIECLFFIGRLDHLIYLGLPTEQDRIDIIKSFMEKSPTSDDVNAETLAKQTEFCTGADLENLFRYKKKK